MNDTGNKNRAVESECGPFHLSQLRGAQSIVFTKAPYLLSAASVAGSKEAQGPLGKCFDLTIVQWKRPQNKISINQFSNNLLHIILDTAYARRFLPARKASFTRSYIH